MSLVYPVHFIAETVIDFTAEFRGFKDKQTAFLDLQLPFRGLFAIAIIVTCANSRKPPKAIKETEQPISERDPRKRGSKHISIELSPKQAFL